MKQTLSSLRVFALLTPAVMCNFQPESVLSQASPVKYNPLTCSDTGVAGRVEKRGGLLLIKLQVL
jgi:hypothetical protein